MGETRLDERARVQRAKAFAEKWAGRGYEKGDTHSFWLELLRDVVGMEDVTALPRITEALLAAGYSEGDVRKIWGGNLLRVLRQVQDASDASAP